MTVILLCNVMPLLQCLLVFLCLWRTRPVLCNFIGAGLLSAIVSDCYSYLAALVSNPRLLQDDHVCLSGHLRISAAWIWQECCNWELVVRTVRFLRNVFRVWAALIPAAETVWPISENLDFFLFNQQLMEQFCWMLRPFYKTWLTSLNHWCFIFVQKVIKCLGFLFLSDVLECSKMFFNSVG